MPPSTHRRWAVPCRGGYLAPSIATSRVSGAGSPATSPPSIDLRRWLAHEPTRPATGFARTSESSAERNGRSGWRREPHALLHFDTCSDIPRLQGTSLRIFDWPFASVGTAEFDAAAFSNRSRPRVVRALTRPWAGTSRLCHCDAMYSSGRSLALRVTLRIELREQAPPGLPRLRSVQRRQLKASLGWAARVLEVPAWLSAVPS